MALEIITATVKERDKQDVQEESAVVTLDL